MRRCIVFVFLIASQIDYKVTNSSCGEATPATSLYELHTQTANSQSKIFHTDQQLTTKLSQDYKSQTDQPSIRQSQSDILSSWGPSTTTAATSHDLIDSSPFSNNGISESLSAVWMIGVSLLLNYLNG